MQCTKHNDARVHSEVEDLEKLRFGKGKHSNSAKFCQSYTAEDLKDEHSTSYPNDYISHRISATR